MNKKIPLLLIISINFIHVLSSKNLVTYQGVRLTSPTIKSVITKSKPTLIAPTLQENREALNIYSKNPSVDEINTAFQREIAYQAETTNIPKLYEAQKNLIDNLTHQQHQLSLPTTSYENLEQIIASAQKGTYTSQEATELFNKLIQQGNYSAASFLYTETSHLNLISQTTLNQALQNSIKNNEFQFIEELNLRNNSKVNQNHDFSLQQKLEESAEKLLQMAIINNDNSSIKNIVQSNIPTKKAITQEFIYEMSHNKPNFDNIHILTKSGKVAYKAIEKAFMDTTEANKYELVNNLNYADTQKIFTQAAKNNDETSMRVLWKSGKVSDYTAKNLYVSAKQSKNETLLGTLRRTTQRPDTDFTDSFFTRAAKTGAKATAAFAITPDSFKDMVWETGVTSVQKAKDTIQTSAQKGKEALLQAKTSLPSIKIGEEMQHAQLENKIDTFIHNQPITSKNTSNELSAEYRQTIEKMRHQPEKFMPENRKVLEHENFIH